VKTIDRPEPLTPTSRASFARLGLPQGERERTTAAEASCLGFMVRLRANAPYPQSSSPGLTGRSSIPETVMRNREAAAYWIPAFAGMTVLGRSRRFCLQQRSCNPSGDLPDGLSGDGPVQPLLQKFFVSRFTQISRISHAVSRPLRGVSRSSRT
jgi:hypothetical protein